VGNKMPLTASFDPGSVVPLTPQLFKSLPPDLRRRATAVWRATHVLLDAIVRWTEWIHTPKSLGGIEVGDAIARNGRDAIEVLRGLNVNSPAFQGHDDPEHPGPLYFWPAPPSEIIDPAWYEAIDSQHITAERDEITRQLFALNHVLVPELNRIVGTISNSPDAVLIQDTHHTQHAVVQLRGAGERPIVLGKEVEPLTEARHRVVSALLAAGPDGMSKPDLDRVKGDAVRYLRELRAGSRLWKAAIRMAGKRGMRYAIKHE